MFTVERLKELVEYDPETGLFIRLNPVCGARIQAGSMTVGGYLTLYLDGKHRKSHRMAWLYMYGELPDSGLDHINGNRKDNRICNIRKATNAQNTQNIRAPYKSNKSSGVLGVYWHTQGRKWQARIQLNKKAKSLGFFETKELASDAYLQAKRRLHEFSTI